MAHFTGLYSEIFGLGYFYLEHLYHRYNTVYCTSTKPACVTHVPSKAVEDAAAGVPLPPATQGDDYGCGVILAGVEQGLGVEEVV